jgi:hypothetical protein
MANDYITLGSLKLTIVNDGVSGEWPRNDTFRVTLASTTHMSIGTGGANVEQWTYEVFVKFVADSGYWSYSALRTAAQDRTVAGQSFNLTDEYGTNRGAVLLAGVEKPERIGVEVDSADAIYKTKIKLIKS